MNTSNFNSNRFPEREFIKALFLRINPLDPKFSNSIQGTQNWLSNYGNK